VGGSGGRADSQYTTPKKLRVGVLWPVFGVISARSCRAESEIYKEKTLMTHKKKVEGYWPARGPARIKVGLGV